MSIIVRRSVANSQLNIRRKKEGEKKKERRRKHERKKKKERKEEKVSCI